MSFDSRQFTGVETVEFSKRAPNALLIAFLLGANPVS